MSTDNQRSLPKEVAEAIERLTENFLPNWRDRIADGESEGGFLTGPFPALDLVEVIEYAHRKMLADQQANVSGQTDRKSAELRMDQTWQRLYRSFHGHLANPNTGTRNEVRAHATDFLSQSMTSPMMQAIPDDLFEAINDSVTPMAGDTPLDTHKFLHLIITSAEKVNHKMKERRTAPSPDDSPLLADAKQLLAGMRASWPGMTKEPGTDSKPQLTDEELQAETKQFFESAGSNLPGKHHLATAKPMHPNHPARYWQSVKHAHEAYCLGDLKTHKRDVEIHFDNFIASAMGDRFASLFNARDRGILMWANSLFRDQDPRNSTSGIIMAELDEIMARVAPAPLAENHSAPSTPEDDDLDYGPGMR